MFKLLTDFNDVINDHVRGLIEDAEGPRAVLVGDRVLLHDDGEHEAWGTVTEVRDGLVRVRMEWETWADAGTYRPQRQDNLWVVGNFETGWASKTEGDDRVSTSEPQLAGAH